MRAAMFSTWPSGLTMERTKNSPDQRLKPRITAISARLITAFWDRASSTSSRLVDMRSAATSSAA